jgi:hypothetical protein
MRRLGIAPGPDAVAQLAVAQQREAAALEAAKRAEIERRASFSHPGGDLAGSLLEEQGRQRAGREFEWRQAENARVRNLVDEEAGRMTIEGMSPPSLETESNARADASADAKRATEAEMRKLGLDPSSPGALAAYLEKRGAVLDADEEPGERDPETVSYVPEPSIAGEERGSFWDAATGAWKAHPLVTHLGGLLGADDDAVEAEEAKVEAAKKAAKTEEVIGIGGGLADVLSLEDQQRALEPAQTLPPEAPPEAPPEVRIKTKKVPVFNRDIVAAEDKILADDKDVNLPASPARDIQADWQERNEASEEFFKGRFEALKTNTANTKAEIGKIKTAAQNLLDFSKTGNFPKNQREAVLTAWFLRTGAAMLYGRDKKGNVLSFAENIGRALEIYSEVESEHKEKYLTGLKDSLNSQKAISELIIAADTAEQASTRALMLAKRADQLGNDKLAADWQRIALQQQKLVNDAYSAKVNATIAKQQADAQTLAAQRPTTATIQDGRLLAIQSSIYQQAVAIEDTVASNAMLEKYFIISNGEVVYGAKGLPLAREDAFMPLYKQDPILSRASAGGITPYQTFGLGSRVSDAESDAQTSYGSFSEKGDFSGAEYIKATNVIKELEKRGFRVKNEKGEWVPWQEGINKQAEIPQDLFIKVYYEMNHRAEIGPGQLLEDSYNRVAGASIPQAGGQDTGQRPLDIFDR